MRLETLAVALAIFVSLVVAALIARRSPVDLGRPSNAEDAESGERNHLRADDLIYISLAAIPGAVIGGRIGYALVHLDYVRATPSTLFDVGWGGLELSLAVVGGVLTAALVAALLGAPLGRWLHAAILPLLLALGAGKLAMVLGGSGQGQPFDGSWATAYVSPGPWGSLAPALPSHPSQAYEGIATWIILLVMMTLVAMGAFGKRSGGLFFLGIGLWAIARALVATTWRDPATSGVLSTDQVICIAIAVVAFILLAVVSGVSLVRGRRAAPPVAQDASELDWPDPSERPFI